MSPSSNSPGTLTYESTYCPRFAGLSCFVLPGAAYGHVVVMMASVGFSKAADIESADIVVFVGGTDVSPSLYGEKNVASSPPFDPERDDYETLVYDTCVKNKTPMLGICRGAQFLHVMNGGTLWQNVTGHGGKDHYIVDLDCDTRVLANSYHHQMLRDNEDLRVIAVTEDQISRDFASQKLNIYLNGTEAHEMEIEAGAYDNTSCLMIQGHPEWGNDYYKSWCMHRLSDFLFNDVAVSPLQKHIDKARASEDEKMMEELILNQIG